MARRRRWLWVLGLCAVVVVGQPLLGGAQGVQGPTSTAFAQLDPTIRSRVCDLVQSLQATFARSPVAAGILASVSQSLGCGAQPTSGSTTTSLFVPGLTTTTGVTLPMPPTTLPPCIPNNPSPTTVPCAPTMTTIFVPSTTSTTITGPFPSTSSTMTTLASCVPSGMLTTTTTALCGGTTLPFPSTSTSIRIP